MSARSTTIGLFTDHCPHAVTLFEQGEARSEVPHIGIVAHDVLHAMGERRNIDKVCEDLIAAGRGGRDAEGPIPADAVFEGRELAERWAADHPLPKPGDGVWYELGIAFDDQWAPMPYDSPGSMLNTRIDRVMVYEDFDEDVGELNIAEAADYKTSWRAGSADLESTQRKIHAVAVWKALKQLEAAHVDCIDVVVINLRTQEEARRRLWLPDDEVILERWQRQLEVLARAVARPRVASPGPGCITCPYARSCKPLAARTPWKGEEALLIAESYARHRAQASAMTNELKAHLDDSHKVMLPDGSAVGFISKEVAVVRPAAPELAWKAWREGEELTDDLVLGFLRAMRLGVTPIRRLIKKLGKDREGRKALEEAWLTTKTQARWGHDPPGTHPTMEDL